MIHKIKFKTAIGVILFLLPLQNVAQFIQAGTGLDQFGRTLQTTPSDIKSIGIGNFTAFPNAALHVNAHFLNDPSSSLFSPGHLFRTDGPSDMLNIWQMFTGGQGSTTATEKGVFFVKPNEDNFYIQASERDIVFNAGGGTERMRITSNGLINIKSLKSDKNTLIIADNNGTLQLANTEKVLQQSKTITKLQTQINSLQKQIQDLQTIVNKL